MLIFGMKEMREVYAGRKKDLEGREMKPPLLGKIHIT